MRPLVGLHRQIVVEGTKEVSPSWDGPRFHIPDDHVRNDYFYLENKDALTLAQSGNKQIFFNRIDRHGELESVVWTFYELESKEAVGGKLYNLPDKFDALTKTSHKYFFDRTAVVNKDTVFCGREDTGIVFLVQEGNYKPISLATALISQETPDYAEFQEALRRMEKYSPKTELDTVRMAFGSGNMTAKDFKLTELPEEKPKNTKVTTNRKGDSNMFDNMFDAKNLEFGMVGEHEGITMSVYGLAVKTSEGRWHTYSQDSGMYDVTGMTMHLPIMKMPVGLAQVKKGDYLNYDDNGRNTPVYVVEKGTSYIKGIKLTDTQEVTIHPAKNLFGFNFFITYRPMVDMDKLGIKPNSDDPFGNIMPLMLMSEMFGGDSAGLGFGGGENGGFMEKMLKFQMMSSMMGNTGNSAFNLPFIGFDMGEEIDLSGSND